MGSTFNPQILVEKLAKLNNSQQSIETLSHWCIFHMNKAKLVVDTWERQFHCSPREQRLSFLYLANDILQNSRRKGSEFVGEFWRVLPDALHDVINSGDEFGRNSALRLISIWDDRKVFGSRGQMLKDEFVKRNQDTSNQNEKHPGIKLSAGSALQKIVADCDGLFGGDLDEDALLNKSRDAISSIEKISEEVTADVNSGKLNESGVMEEVLKHQAVLRYCIEQFNAIETLRTTILSHLSEAKQEQEHRLDQVRHQRQAAESLAEKAAILCRQFPNGNNIQMVFEQGLSETHTFAAPNTFMTRDGEQSGPVIYTPHAHFPESSGHGEENHRKSAAAAVAAKLTASTSSAEMLSFVPSSLASEGVIGNAVSESAGDYHSEKRPKLENNDQPYIPPSHSSPQPPLPPFQQPDSDHQSEGTTAQQLGSNEQPPPPPHPPFPPYSMPQFLQSAAGSMTSVPYTYGATLLQPPLVPGYSTSGTPGMGISPFTAPPNNNGSYQNFQGPDGGFYNHPSSLPMAPQ